MGVADLIISGALKKKKKEENTYNVKDGTYTAEAVKSTNKKVKDTVDTFNNVSDRIKSNTTMSFDDDTKTYKTKSTITDEKKQNKTKKENTKKTFDFSADDESVIKPSLKGEDLTKTDKKNIYNQYKTLSDKQDKLVDKQRGKNSKKVLEEYSQLDKERKEKWKNPSITLDEALDKNSVYTKNYGKEELSNAVSKKDKDKLSDLTNTQKYTTYLKNAAYEDTKESTALDKIFGPLAQAGGLVTGLTKIFPDTRYKDENGNYIYLPNKLDLYTQRVQNDYDTNIGKFYGDVAGGASKIAASELVNLAAPGVGSGLYYGSMFGENIADANNKQVNLNGKNNGARTLINAGIKTGLEFLTGKFLGSATKGLTGGTASELEKGISNKVYNKLSKLGIEDSTLKTFASNLTGKVGSEGTEEFSQNYLENMVDIITLGSDGKHTNILKMISDPDVLSDAIYAGLVGGATGGLFGAVSGDATNVDIRINKLNLFKNAIEEDINNTTDPEKKQNLQNIIDNINKNLQNPFSIEEDTMQDIDNDIISNINTDNDLYSNINEENVETPYEEETELETPLNEINQELQEVRQNDIEDSVQALNLEEDVDEDINTVETLEEETIANSFETYLKENNIENLTKEDIQNFIQKAIEEQGNISEEQKVELQNKYFDSIMNYIDEKIKPVETPETPIQETEQQIKPETLNEETPNTYIKNVDNRITPESIKQENKTEEKQESIEKTILSYKEQKELNELRILDNKGLATEEELKKLRKLENKEKNIIIKYPELKVHNTFDDVKQAYFKYQNKDITPSNKTLLNKAKRIIEANSQGRRTIEQWKAIAEFLGSNSNVKNSNQLQQLALETWFETRPNTKDHLNRQGKGFVRFGVDDWVNEVYKGAGVGQEIKQQIINKFNGYTDKEINNIESSKIKIANNEEDIINYAKDIKNKKNTFNKMYLGKIKEKVSDYIKNKLGINVDNYNISLNKNGIEHSINHHSSESELLRGQVPITEEDFKNIPTIINEADSITRGYDTTNNKPSITFEKNIGGNNVVVTYVSDKHHNLELQTMYKFKNNKKINSVTAVNENNSLTSTSKTNSDTNLFESNISQKDNNVKQELDNSSFSLKQKQNDIIQKSNPQDKELGEHTWINSVDDIKTFKEAVEDDDYATTPDFTEKMINEALDSGKVTVYSSYPIEQGTFVTPSKMEAESYAGSNKVYSKEVPLEDVAWIDSLQGQYASVKSEKNQQTTKSTTETKAALEKSKNPVEDSVKAMNLQNKQNKQEVKDTNKALNLAKDNKYKEKLYHGTDEIFDEYDIDKFGKHDQGDFGQAVYFTKNKNTASKYGKNIKTTDVELDNPYVINSENDYAKLWHEVAKKVDKNNLSKEDLELYNDKYTPQKEKDFMLYDTLNAKEKRNIIKNMGYDGIVDNTYNQVAVFDTDRINKNTINENKQEDKIVLRTPTQIEPNKIKTPKQKQQYFEESGTPPKVAKILSETPRETETSNLREIYQDLKRAVVDKGEAIYRIAKQTKNRKLYAMYDRMGLATGEGNSNIGNAQANLDGKNYTNFTDSKGNKTAMSLTEIWDDVEKSGIPENVMNEYLAHYLNVDRYKPNSLTKEETERLKELKKYKGNRISQAEREEIKALEDLAELRNVFGESITREDSLKKVHEIEEQYPQITRPAENIWQYGKNQLQKMVDAGLVSKEMQEQFNKDTPHYVRIQRDIQKNQSPIFDRGGHIKVNNQIKKAKGGTKDIIPFKDSMAQYTLDTTSSIRRNLFGQELSKTLQNGLDVDGNLDIDNVDNNILNKNDDGSYTFTVYEDGNPKVLTIDKGIYESLQPNKHYDFEKAFTPFKKLSNLKRDLLTEKNPLFLATNFFKDFFDAPLNTKHSTVDFVKNYAKAINQISTNGELYQQYMALGGNQNTYFDKEGYKKDSKLEKVFAPIEKANNFIEMLPRLSEFITSIEKGESLDEAMYNAAEITTNFKRGGTATKIANRNGATFLNASVQGFDKQIRNFTEIENPKQAVRLMTKALVLGVAPALLNAAMYDDDDEYEDIPDYIKDSYYLFKTGKDNKWIRIPKGRAISVIQAAARRGYDYSKGNKDAFKGLAGHFENQLAPNNPLSSNVLSPLVDIKNNTSWNGSKIVSDSLENKAHPEEEYDAKTDELSKWLGKKLGKSPKKINYLIDQNTGAIGDLLLPFLTKQAEGEDDSLVGRLVKNPVKDKFTTDSVLNSKKISDFYDAFNLAEDNKNWSKATDEDVLKYKYLYPTMLDLGSMNKEIKQIEESDLSDKDKYKLTKERKQEMNKLAKKAVEESDNIKIYDSYAQVGDKYYKKQYDSSTGEYKYTKVQDKQLQKVKDKGVPLVDYFNELYEKQKKKAAK